MRHSELNNFLDNMTDDSGRGRSEGHRHMCPRAINTAVVRGCGGTLQSEPRICKQRSYAGRCRVGGLSPEEGRFASPGGGTRGLFWWYHTRCCGRSAFQSRRRKSPSSPGVCKDWWAQTIDRSMTAGIGWIIPSVSSALTRLFIVHQVFSIRHQLYYTLIDSSGCLPGASHDSTPSRLWVALARPRKPPQHS